MRFYDFLHLVSEEPRLKAVVKRSDLGPLCFNYFDLELFDLKFE